MKNLTHKDYTLKKAAYQLMLTLIPLLETMHQHLNGKQHANIIADAGHESEENYLYLEAAKQNCYIKLANLSVQNQDTKAMSAFTNAKTAQIVCINQVVRKLREIAE